MNVLDSPLEALAFNYQSFGFLTAVSNIWAWVAVITAAVSFWKIRAAGSTCHSEIAGLAKSEHRDSRNPDMLLAKAAAVENNEPIFTVTDEVTRGVKFTVYYDENEGEEEDLMADDGGAGGFPAAGGGGGGGGGEEEYYWDIDWERGLRMRMGEDVSLGWYRHQDLTVLDGNVVKLWDSDIVCNRRKFEVTILSPSQLVSGCFLVVSIN